jgi:hypothetical protein
MSENWDSIFSVFVGAWLLYGVLRPAKDYYVLERRHFDRLYEPPWRGELKLCSPYHHGFENYFVAKAAFDLHEGYLNTDSGRTEAEHSLFMVPAKSKSAAIARLKGNKAYDKELLHMTPFRDILKRRKAAREDYEALEEILGKRE